MLPLIETRVQLLSHLMENLKQAIISTIANTSTDWLAIRRLEPLCHSTIKAAPMRAMACCNLQQLLSHPSPWKTVSFGSCSFFFNWALSTGLGHFCRTVKIEPGSAHTYYTHIHMQIWKCVVRHLLIFYIAAILGKRDSTFEGGKNEFSFWTIYCQVWKSFNVFFANQ